MAKLAIMNNGDTPQLESTAVMLRAAGYELKACGGELRAALISAGCDTVLSVETMYALGYDRLDASIGFATPADMERCDLFVEIKVRNVPKILERWPRLKGKICYWRVNGAQPEICPKGGDEVNLPCPVITACMWYGTNRYYQDETTKPVQAQAAQEHEASRPVGDDLKNLPRQLGENGMAYTFWPPYPRSAPYDRIDRSTLTEYSPPYCLCHSTRAWGYGGMLSECVDLGIKCFGNNSPAGQISHADVPAVTAKALALVHLKSVDCPGWALYEAMLSGTPVVTGRLLNSRMLAYDLLEHGETCLEFGVPASLEYGRGDPDLPKCLADIKEALERLKDPVENRRIGENGRKRLNELMWTEQRDGNGFRAFMHRWFGS